MSYFVDVGDGLHSLVVGPAALCVPPIQTTTKLDARLRATPTLRHYPDISVNFEQKEATLTRLLVILYVQY